MHIKIYKEIIMLTAIAFAFVCLFMLINFFFCFLTMPTNTPTNNQPICQRGGEKNHQKTQRNSAPKNAFACATNCHLDVRDRRHRWRYY